MRIRDSSGGGLAVVDPEPWVFSQMMAIRGKLYENVAVQQLNAVSVPSFRITDGEANTVALISGESFTNSSIEETSPYTVPAGSLILAGRGFLGNDPDRSSSQGE